MTDNPSGAKSIHPGVYMPEHVLMEEGVIIEHGVVFAETPGHPTIIRAGASVGAGAVIGTGLEIGWGAYIRPGAVVLSSVPANAIASGNPAQIVGYTTELPGEGGSFAHTVPSGNRQKTEVMPLTVGKAALYHMLKVLDLRGNLTVGEFDASFPFPPKRYFAVFDVPSEKLRGEHAHYECHQFLIGVSG